MGSVVETWDGYTKLSKCLEKQVAFLSAFSTVELQEIRVVASFLRSTVSWAVYAEDGSIPGSLEVCELLNKENRLFSENMYQMTSKVYICLPVHKPY